MEKCRPKTVRHRATARGNACCLIASMLCENHAYPFEWVSGQESRLTKEGKSIICKTDNVVPLVVSGLTVNSGRSSSLHRCHRNRWEQKQTQASGNRAASSSSSSSVFERSEEEATRRLGQESLKIQNQNKKRDDKKDADDPLADLPFWFEDVTDNLKPTEVHAPAHSSQDGALVAYSNGCFVQGVQHHSGSQLLAAVMDRWPSFSRFGSNKLPRNLPHVAMSVVILRVTYMRPPELLTLNKKGLVPPVVPLLPCWSIVISAYETGVSTPVLMDQRWLQWVNKLLPALKAGNPEVNIWNFERPAAAILFTTATKCFVSMTFVPNTSHRSQHR